MSNPADYRHIRAWGCMMHSHEYYIKAQQEQAAMDDAPIDAIYKRGLGKGAWRVFSGCENAETTTIITRILEEIK